MRMPGVLSTLTRDRRRELPGVSGPARTGRDTGAVLRRIRPGDIAVLDHVDLDRPTADALVVAGAAAVVNASPSISGRFPNLGPEALVSAGITLVDGVGPELLRLVRDGVTLRVHDGGVFHGERLVGRGVPQTADSVASAMAEARVGLVNQLEAFSANTIEFMRRDRALLLDGVGVPEVRVPLVGRHVLVVTAGPGHVEELAGLHRYLKEHHPVLVGVGAGADALWAAGHRPHLVVGDPAEISDQVLTCGADVVVPAFADGHAPGLHRVQDLGAGAVTFPASGNPEDLALLLVHHHGARAIITVGCRATLAELLDRARSGGNASTFLTRLKVGGLLVEGKVAAELYRAPVTTGAVALFVAAIVMVVTAAMAVTSAGPALLGHLDGAWTSVAELLTGWF